MLDNFHDIISYSVYLIINFFLCFFFFKNYPILTKNFKLINNQNTHYNFNPTPTGSGIIFSVSLLFGIFYFYLGNENFVNLLPNRYYFLFLGMFILSLISLYDDIKTIDPILRLIIQTITVYLSLTCLDLNNVQLPLKLSMLLSLIIWIYIINITNFIDGSDGFCTINIIFIFLNIFILTFYFPNYFSFVLAMILLPSLIVFFIYNRPPAKIYMGDAGSIGLGFILGFIFLELFISAQYGIAISLLSYFITDCTTALLKKFRRGIMPWVGLYDYYYLIPTLKNKVNHANVLCIIIGYNIINTLIIYFQLTYQNQFLCLLSIILSFLTMFIFKNLEGNLSFLKIFNKL